MDGGFLRNILFPIIDTNRGQISKKYTVTNYCVAYLSEIDRYKLLKQMDARFIRNIPFPTILILRGLYFLAFSYQSIIMPTSQPCSMRGLGEME